MKDRILSCIDYLGSDCTLVMPEPVNIVIQDKAPLTNLSEQFLCEVDKVQDAHMDLFHQFKSEEEDLLELVESLRNRLAMSPYSVPGNHSSVPSERIKFVS